MTSITDIPLSDTKLFLSKNGQKIPVSDDKIYSELDTIILSGKIMKFYPDSIIDWIVAHNLILSNKNINSYKESEINSLSYDELKDLAFILKLDYNQFKNREGLQNSIINILFYLGKLEKLELDIDIKSVIKRKLEKLESKDIDIEALTTKDIIDLLKTHRDKASIRKIIYQNMKQIIFHNILNINFKILDDPEEINYFDYIERQTNKLPKSDILELIKNSKQKIIQDNFEEIINFVDKVYEIKEEQKIYRSDYQSDGIEIGQNMSKLLTFLKDLIKIDEIGLAKIVFDIATEYKLIFNVNIKLNNYLIDYLLYGNNIDINFFKKVINFIGEDNFIKEFTYIIYRDRNDRFLTKYLKQFVEKLIETKDYNFVFSIFEVLVSENYNNKGEIIDKILPYIKKAVLSKKEHLLRKYINILDFFKGGKSFFIVDPSDKINKFIADAEQD